MERIILCWALLSLCYIRLQGQIEPTTESIDSLLVIADAATYDEEYFLTDSLAGTALDLARAIHYQAGQARALRLLGYASEMEGRLDTAKNFYLRSLENWREQGDSTEVARVCRDLSILQETEGNYVSQLKYAEQGYNAASSLNGRDTLLGDLAIDLANTCLNFGNTEDALKLFKESFAIHDGNQDTERRSIALYGLANASYFMDNLDSAEYYINSANLDFIALADTARLAQSYNLTGVILLDQYKADSAEWYLQNSLSLAKRIEEPNLQADALENLITLYTNNNDSKALDSTFSQINALSNHSTSYGKPDVTQMSKLTSYMKMRQLDSYQVLLLGERNTVLQQRFWLLRLLIILLLATIIIIGTSYTAAKRKRQRELAHLTLQQQKERHQKEQLLHSINTRIEQARWQGAEEIFAKVRKYIHNSISSQLAATKWKIEPLLESYQKNIPLATTLEDIQEMLEQALKDSRNIKRTLEKGMENWIQKIEQLFSSLQNTQNPKPKIKFEKLGTDFTLKPGLGSQIFQIINIILANTLTHAEANNFTCQLIANEDELILITRDDGKGFDVDTARKKEDSSGIKNLECIVGELNGQITIDSANNEGTTITITIPLIT